MIRQQFGAAQPPAGGWTSDAWGLYLKQPFSPVSYEGLDRCLIGCPLNGVRILAPDARPWHIKDWTKTSVVRICPEVLQAAVINPMAKMVDLWPQLHGPWGVPCQVSFCGWRKGFIVGHGNNSIGVRPHQPITTRWEPKYKIC